MEKTNELHCSFCGKNRWEVKKLIAGSGVYICDECIELCNDIIEEELAEEIPSNIEELPTPEELFEKLNEYVIGQEEAKKVLSVAVYNHYKRILVKDQNEKNKKRRKSEDEVELEKSNVMLLGPTGCGKTLLAKTLAKILKVPFAITDATSLTEAGYVGEDVESVVLSLLQSANGDVELASRGIIYVDEIDKVARKGENKSITRDVSGEGVQQALLKIIEGAVASVSPRGGRRHPEQETTKIDTRNILFICGGAFSGLEKIIKARLRKKTVGFVTEKLAESSEDADQSTIFKHAQPQDLIKFGLIPEFIGRIPVMTHVNQLDQDALLKILTEPKGALVKQYAKLFDMDKVRLTFTEEALKVVATEAIQRGTGARGLRAVMELAMTDIMFRLPSEKGLQEVVIDKATFLTGAAPMKIYLNQSESA